MSRSTLFTSPRRRGLSSGGPSHSLRRSRGATPTPWAIGLCLGATALGCKIKVESGPRVERVTIAGAQCEDHQIACGLDCVTFQEDPAHCGSCDTVCSEQELCDQGRCVPQSQGCSDGLLACSAGCRQPETSIDHCGQCDNACPSEGECNNGQCACSDNLTVCADRCADLQTSELDCGQCGQACADTQTCEQGTCQCPGTETLCGDSCTDTSASPEHCGQCGNACAEGQICGEGQCACPGETLLCDNACTDTLSDADHCGQCGNACTGGQVCGEGECSCPTGQAFCDGQCIDVLADDQNCGGCGIACGLGDGCITGRCQSGLPGEDNCQGLASDIAISQISAYQTLEVEVMRDGQASQTPISTLVAGRDTLVRLFVQPQAQWQPRPLSARLHLDSGSTLAEPDPSADAAAAEAESPSGDTNGETQVADETAPDSAETNSGQTTRYSTEAIAPEAISSEFDRQSTFEFLVPGELITSSTQFAAELVECDPTRFDDPTEEPAPPDASETNGEQQPTDLVLTTPTQPEAPRSRFPATEGEPLNALDTGTLQVHFVPIVANGRLADTSEEVIELYQSAFLLTYPVATVEVSVGEPLEIADPEQWEDTLTAVRLRRQQDNPDPGVYYYGLVQPTERFGQFCQGGCIAGVGYVPQGNFINPVLRSSVGLSFGDSTSAFTMLHEVGHNHGRGHSPCVPQGAQISGVDDNYPHNGGLIGETGYFAAQDQLIEADAATDLMGYCPNQWLSDYTYNGLFNTILTLNSAQTSEAPDPARLGVWRIALLNSSGQAHWGGSTGEESFAAGTPGQATVTDASGQAVGTVTVYQTAVGDGGYSFDVPTAEAGWFAVQLPGGQVLPF